MGSEMCIRDSSTIFKGSGGDLGQNACYAELSGGRHSAGRFKLSWGSRATFMTPPRRPIPRGKQQIPKILILVQMLGTHVGSRLATGANWFWSHSVFYSRVVVASRTFILRTREARGNALVATQWKLHVSTTMVSRAGYTCFGGCRSYWRCSSISAGQKQSQNVTTRFDFIFLRTAV